MTHFDDHTNCKSNTRTVGSPAISSRTSPDSVKRKWTKPIGALSLPFSRTTRKPVERRKADEKVVSGPLCIVRTRCIIRDLVHLVHVVPTIAARIIELQAASVSILEEFVEMICLPDLFHIVAGKIQHEVRQIKWQVAASVEFDLWLIAIRHTHHWLSSMPSTSIESISVKLHERRHECLGNVLVGAVLVEQRCPKPDRRAFYICESHGLGRAEGVDLPLVGALAALASLSAAR